MATAVFVDGLPLHFTHDDLHKLFTGFGRIETAFVAKLPTGRSLGFGFVRFAYFTDAEEAVQALSGSLVLGHTLTAYIADAPKRDFETGTS